MDAQDSTVTDQRSGVRVGENPRLWKLRPLYVGAAGIVESTPKLWDGVLPLTIGRHAPPRAEGPWLVVEDERVSREHARVESAGDSVMLHDCGSKNGTQLNGKTLPANGCLRLSDGDVIGLGRSLLLVRHEVATHADAAIASLVGVSTAACQLRHSIAQAAPSGQPVLLLGETGTGKEVAAHALHRVSGRTGKLVPVNCAAIPATLAESLFFGVHRGAFTGAVSSPGLFIEAEAGTLFLDEVGELPVDLQAKLLRAIEQQEFLQLGSTKPVRCDVRIVAATNRDLAQAVQRGGFRADLYARLAALVLTLPPLLQRREDVLRIAQHFAGNTLALSPSLAEAMVLYEWPFNVRELRNVVGRIQDGASESALLSMLRPGTQASAGTSLEIAAAVPAQARPAPSRGELSALLEQYAGNLLRIEQTHGYSRRQLRRWADKFGLNIDRFCVPK
jgi:transcriptional regulator with PAS, ATPase and Fis domain